MPIFRYNEALLKSSESKWSAASVPVVGLIEALQQGLTVHMAWHRLAASLLGARRAARDTSWGLARRCSSLRAGHTPWSPLQTPWSLAATSCTALISGARHLMAWELKGLRFKQQKLHLPAHGPHA